MQPVPPIFQPEVAARAIVFAAHARRREVWVGGPTIKAILANKIAPGLLDRYLARHGYRSQLSHESRDPDAPNNLFDAVPGDPGAHGRFDRQATSLEPRPVGHDAQGNPARAGRLRCYCSPCRRADMAPRLADWLRHPESRSLAYGMRESLNYAAFGAIAPGQSIVDELQPGNSSIYIDGAVRLFPLERRARICGLLHEMAQALRW
ncbi:MAG: hypothetical protein ACYCP0_06500 [Acidiferrobacteraceae bacterium]